MSADVSFQRTVDLIAASIAMRANPHDPELHDRYVERQRSVEVHGPHERARELQRRLGLTPAEMSVIWLLAAIAVSDEAREATVTAIGCGASAELSLAQIQRLLLGSANCSLMADLSESAPLRQLSLIERTNGSDDVHEVRQLWTVSPRVLSFLFGQSGMDFGLRQFAELVEPETENGVAADEQVATAVANALANGALLIVEGARGLGRRTMIRSAVLKAGRTILELDAARLAKAEHVFAKQMRIVARELRLLDAIPLIRNLDELTDAQIAGLESDFAPNVVGPILATVARRRAQLKAERPSLVVTLKAPSTAERAQLWHSELGQGTQEDAEYLATQYPLAPALIHHAAKAAKARANGRKMQPEDIYAGIRAVLDDKLGDYARRVEVTQSWEDIVLPEDTIESIQYLIARIRQRRTVYEQWGFAAKVGKGLGTSALFSGPPGTGKTMICALIAKELGLELYQVDMAKITSKYIGETERNLAALFDAAEAGHAILLFDEADSLFGKRTDVKSSNDRYANLETNYLLQRLESFTGICLLTSNHESAIDAAFMRRLSLHLRFELPEAEERALLWQAMLPPAAPVAPGVDFMALAQRFSMSGGYIRNAALRAAFMAADEGAAITALHLERAARLEYEAMGKIAFAA